MTPAAVILLGYALALAGVLCFGRFVNWGGVNLAVRPEQLAGLLAPVAFAAAVIERGVETLINPWRDAGAAALTNSLAAATTAQDTAKMGKASDALAAYKATTQRYAFSISLIVGVLVSISGVRAFGPFADLAAPKTTLAGHQEVFFHSIDVALTALLLAGGADGVHTVVNAVTKFFDASAQKSSGS